MSLSAFLGFYLLTLMGAISPGPAVLMSARTGLTEGFRTGTFLAMGIGLGACFWAVCAMSGLGVVFAYAPWALTALKIGGGAFLVWTGVKLWRHAKEPLSEGEARATPRGAASALWLGLVTQLTNPKPVVVMSAIFLGTVPPTTPFWQYLALLAVIFVNETVWNMSVARIFSLDRTRARYISLKTMLDRLFGGMLLLFGLKVAVT
jgi:threonine/homoserine/homoserine lactone efflux protein